MCRSTITIDQDEIAAPAAITWLGHSTVLVEVNGIRILTDPVIRSRVGPLVRIAAPVQPETVRDIDVILLSHLHADHTDPGSLRRIGTAVEVIAPDGAAPWLRRRGLLDVRELNGVPESLGPVSISATPAVHAGRRHRLAPRSASIGFMIHGSRSIYFAGDTDLFPEMAGLRGRVDVALLPVSGWGPKVGPGHLDPGRAAEAVERIRPRIAIPIHWGTLALPWAARGPRAPKSPAEVFAELVATATPETAVKVLAPGERVLFP